MHESVSQVSPLSKQVQLAHLRPSAPPAVWFVSYGAGHAAALAPVAALLSGQGVPVLCLGLTTAPAVFARYGIEAVGMREMIAHAPGYRRVARLGRRLKASAEQHGAIDDAETEAYLGAGFLALVRTHGLRRARVMYRQRGRQGFCPVDFFAVLFAQYRPAVVVATSAPRSERAAIEAARTLGLARLCLVDLYAPSEVQWCATPGYADPVCVLSEQVGLHLERHDVPTHKIRVTSNPSFDRLRDLDRAQLRHALRTRLGLDTRSRVVAWVSQEEKVAHPFRAELVGDPALPARIDEAMAAYAAAHPGVHVIIRLHPNETRPMRELGRAVSYSLRSDSLDELLCGADCILTAGSTVGLEAAMLGTPVLQFTGSIFSDDLPLARLGLADAVASVEGIGAAVDAVLSGRKEDNGTVDALRRLVGSAGMNVAKEISILYLNQANRE